MNEKSYGSNSILPKRTEEQAYFRYALFSEITLVSYLPACVGGMQEGHGVGRGVSKPEAWAPAKLLEIKSAVKITATRTIVLVMGWFLLGE